MMYSEELKEIWKSEKLHLQKIKAQIQNSLFYSIFRTYPVLYSKSETHSNVPVITFNGRIPWFEMYLTNILLNFH